MKRRHFEVFRPVCPVCRKRKETFSPLAVGVVAAERDGDILEGTLICSDEACRSEFPVIDGIPILLAELREYVSQNIFPILRRKDLSGLTESLVGDCCGAGSAVDTLRQRLSIYGFDHYGNLAPDAVPGDGGATRPGGIVRLIGECEFADANIDGPIIDFGCSVGRSAFELARMTGQPVLGVDLDFDMLRMASEVLRDGIVAYPLRRGGVVYDQKRYPVRLPQAENVDFWACDAVAPPFPPEIAACAVSLNLLDCVTSPFEHLLEMIHLLKPGGIATITTPYDWNPAATPIERWIGGHSQRAEHGGRSETLLKALLDGDGVHTIPAVALAGEVENIPWHVRLHDRSVMTYLVHLLRIRKAMRIQP